MNKTIAPSKHFSILGICLLVLMLGMALLCFTACNNNDSSTDPNAEAETTGYYKTTKLLTSMEYTSAAGYSYSAQYTYNDAGDRILKETKAGMDNEMESASYTSDYASAGIIASNSTAINGEPFSVTQYEEPYIEENADTISYAYPGNFKYVATDELDAVEMTFTYDLENFHVSERTDRLDFVTEDVVDGADVFTNLTEITTFDDESRMTSLTQMYLYTSGQVATTTFMSAEYEGLNLLTQILASDPVKWTITLDDDGYITQIESANGDKAVFTYTEQEDITNLSKANALTAPTSEFFAALEADFNQGITPDTAHIVAILEQAIDD